MTRTLEVNPADSTLDISIRYILLDAAPPVADMPFMFFPDQVWTLSSGGSTVATMNGVLLVFDGQRDGDLIDPVILASPLREPPPPLGVTTIGGAFPVTAENAGLLEFTAKDKFLAYYYDPIKDPTAQKLLKTTVKLAQKVDWTTDTGIIRLLWSKKIRLYNAKVFKAWMKGGGTAAEFLAPEGPVTDLPGLMRAPVGNDNQQPLDMTLKTVNKANDPAERDLGTITLVPPRNPRLQAGRWRHGD